MAAPESGNVTAAKNFLRGQQAEPEALLGLAKRLKKEQAFGYARRILALASARLGAATSPELRRTIAQQHALCTYKDPDLPDGERLDRALEILSSAEDLTTTTNQETLGIAGAIHKRKWEVDARREHLERSLAYYLRGYHVGATSDDGYTGINAAFVLDLLADVEEREARRAATTSSTAQARRQEARAIRLDLVTKLPQLLRGPEQSRLEKDWWFPVTLAEAYFGLGRYDDARPWLQQARGAPVEPWEFESTVRQLAALARLQTGAAAPDQGHGEAMAWNVLFDFLGDKAPGVETAFLGKIGLALSGGGFRASLFHIGVLAYLAERDVLRHVQVLSCVSGGSIIGAHYYLEVRNLLKTKADREITRDDYIAIVQRIAHDFLAGVQQNVRTRVLAGLWTNLKMMLWPNYSRTERLGELLERKIFSRVDDGESRKARWLTKLFVSPKGESDGFVPKYDNWRRRNKVPVMILNATTLNTGHNWQFTASWMGEPPAGIDAEIDGNYRLRRMYYDEAPPAYRRVRLGHAVAASACVPGLFEPLVLKDLYPGKTVRLVDGGVFDNQGVTGLLDQGCTLLLVSDAAGQMETRDDPSAGLLGVPLRSGSVLMARVRQSQYHELNARRQSGLLRGLMFLHLKKDLDADPVDWAGCDDPYEASEDARPVERRGVLTSYRMRKDVQQRLAAIRTDLDSFADGEAYALMLSAYRMAQREFDGAIEGFREPPPGRPPWPFLAVQEAVDQSPTHKRMMRLLEVAKYPAFKVWRLVWPLTVLGVLLLVAAAAGLAYLTWTRRTLPLVTVGSAGWTIAGLVAAALVGGLLVRVIWFRKTVGQVGIVTAASLVVCVVARIHLLLFDWLYLRWGRVKHIVNQSPGGWV